MKIKYFIFALGTLFASQALASPIQATTDVISAPFEGRDVAAKAIHQPYSTPRREDAAYLNARGDAPPAVTAHPHDDNLEIEEKHSAKGKKYHIVRPKGSSALEAAARKNGDATLRRATFFKKTVWWPAGGYGITDIPFVDDTGIEQWSLNGAPWYSIFYEWRLNFLTEYHLDYGFTDQTDDTYWCNVFISGMHYIDFNSRAASIVTVQA